MRIIVVLVFLLSTPGGVTPGRYLADWSSLDTRPLPRWYDDVKFGIFIHWGVYSVPSYGSEHMWYNWITEKNPKIVKFMKENYRPGFTYPEFAPQFTASLWDPDGWADLFQASGAGYVVLTAKHHEGYTLWPSNSSWNWNSVDVGPKRDLVGDLAKSIRKRTKLHFGLYHSLYEWYNPLYLQDVANKFKTQTFVKRKTMAELYDLTNSYRPDVIWSDGAHGPSSYWNSTEFIAWLYNDSPVRDTVVVNDRWGSDHIMCKHGDFWTCRDSYNPGHIVPHKWENCVVLQSGSWGYNRISTLNDYLTLDNITQLLAETVSCGGNLLLDIGPTKDGMITPLFEERLRETGDWLRVNGEAIYRSKPWRCQNDTKTSGVWYTMRTEGDVQTVYAIVLKWPANQTSLQLKLACPSPSNNTRITLLGYSGGPLSFRACSRSGGIIIDLPVITSMSMRSRSARVLRFTSLKKF